MMLSTFLEQFGKPLSLVTLCSSTFGLFVFIEQMSFWKFAGLMSEAT